MTESEINEQLRLVVKNLITDWPRRNVGKCLFGTTGYSQMDKWLDGDINFGLKPLNRVGAVINRVPVIVFVDSANVELIAECYKENIDFLNKLNGDMLEKLTNNNIPSSSNSKKEIDSDFLDLLLNETKV